MDEVDAPALVADECSTLEEGVEPAAGGRRAYGKVVTGHSLQGLGGCPGTLPLRG